MVVGSDPSLVYGLVQMIEHVAAKLGLRPHVVGEPREVGSPRPAVQVAGCPRAVEADLNDVILLVAEVQAGAYGRNPLKVRGGKEGKQPLDLGRDVILCGERVKVVLANARARLPAKLGAQ